MDLVRQKQREKMNSHHLRAYSLRSEEDTASVGRGIQREVESWLSRLPQISFTKGTASATSA